MASRSSSVWQYFVVSSVNESRVTCNLCKTSLARGGKAANKHGFGTSNLRKHLQAKHNDEYLALVASETTVKTLPSNSASSSSSQSTLSSTGTFSENVHQTTLTKVPMYVAIKRALQSISDDSGVQTMKKEPMKELDSRFGDVKTEPLFVVATLVDPRYRGKLLSGNEMADAQKHLIELAETNEQQQPAAQSDASTPDVVEPAAKRPRLQDASPLDLLDDELQAATVPSEFTVANEVADFLRQPNIQRQLSPLGWWKHNEQKYRRVAHVARRYMSAPSTSVPSERLFSSAGDLYSDSRNRLSGHRADMLLFIKHNLKYM